MALAHLSIGSNTGERMFYLQNALKIVKDKIGKIVSKSSVYESQSWGYEGKNFLNLIIKIETSFSPVEILNAIHEIEADLGRKKVSGSYADRTIDLDILFYDDKIINTENLVIPHPQLQNRLFVLVPLLDVDPEFIHPILNKNMKQLRHECKDQGWIRFYDEIK